MPAPLVALFAAQRCLVTYPQARGAGLSSDEIETRCRRGDWVVAQRGVYRLAGAELGWRQDLLAAIAATGWQAVASHETALAVLGVREAPSVLEVTVHGTALPLLSGVVVHRTRELPSQQVLTVEGLRTTVGARAAIDCAGRFDLADTMDLVDDLVGAHRAGRPQIHRLATSLANGRRGVPRLARITAADAGPELRSWLERDATMVFALAGLPPARWNHPVHRAGRLLGVADGWWEQPAVVELDGAAFHATAKQRRADAARDRRFLRAGIPTFRYGYRDLAERPQEVVDELAEVLGVRARRLDPAVLAAERARRPPFAGGVSTRRA